MHYIWMYILCNCVSGFLKYQFMFCFFYSPVCLYRQLLNGLYWLEFCIDVYFLLSQRLEKPPRVSQYECILVNAFLVNKSTIDTLISRFSTVGPVRASALNGPGEANSLVPRAGRYGWKLYHDISVSYRSISIIIDIFYDPFKIRTRRKIYYI